MLEAEVAGCGMRVFRLDPERGHVHTVTDYGAVRADGPTTAAAMTLQISSVMTSASP
jgi:hypothetical protein